MAAAAYEDRLIEGGNLAPDVSAAMQGVGNPEGWPRAFSIQGTTSRITRDGADSNETGVMLGGMLDTPDYGAFTLEANYRSSDGYGFGAGSLVSLWQRGLPMDDDWYGNNALGVFNTPSTDLARTQYRFYVPTLPVNGAGTEWRRDGDVQVIASVGEPGLYAGIYVPTFESLHGVVTTGGLQWEPTPGWSTALQLVDARDVRTEIGRGASSDTLSEQSLFGAVAWDGEGARAQANLVTTSTDGKSIQFGGWADASVLVGDLTHNFGAFRLDPNLLWGNQPLASDLEGGYYRAAWQSRRWVVDGGLDYVRPVEGAGDDTLYATGYARYQYSSTLGYGAGGNLRESNDNAWSVFGFVDDVNRFGVGRVQGNYATDPYQDYMQLTLDQTWNMPAATRLSTALMFGRQDLQTYDSNTIGVAVYGGGQLRGNLSLDLNLNYNKGYGRASFDNTLANIALNWAMGPGWTLTANYYENRNDGQIPLVVSSPVPGAPEFQEESSNERGAYLSVRYEWQAGSRRAPLGGVPGSGAGSVSGVLYLDGNDNGRRDAGEPGAPNVAVLLDGKFSSRTDSEGRFEFSAVVAGTHQVTVLPDNLALPWAVPTNQPITVRVDVRVDSRVEIGARRLR
ncbi:MAG TPA: hypothetical protein PK163_05490 [Steroidobacteraceae bacterium]|nr:hypothetical protein [Steroidobacteraceae bacterium]